MSRSPRLHATTLALAALALALLGGCAGALPLLHGARASDARSRQGAATAFDLGVAAYQRGEYARALASFERAEQLEPAPAVLFNLARVHDTLGHDAAAANFYLAYARAVPALAPGDQREIAAALARLAPRVGWIVVRAERAAWIGSDLVLDGVRDAGVPEPFAVNPGLRTVRVQGREPVTVRARVGEVIALDFAAEADGARAVLVESEPLEDLRLADSLRARATTLASAASGSINLR